MDRLLLAIIRELRRFRERDMPMTLRDIYMRVLQIQQEVALDGDEDQAVKKCGNAYLMCVGLLEQIQPELKGGGGDRPE